MDKALLAFTIYMELPLILGVEQSGYKKDRS